MFLENLKKQGFKKAVQMELQRYIGLGAYQNQIDTLFYFLNKYADVSQVRPAEGALRELQLCNVQLLAILHEVCTRNGLTYWIDYGTLLGAYRHKGFIPWDDDIDVCMLRDDYERAVKILPQIMGAYGIDAVEEATEPSVRIGVGYMHKKTGIWLDIFPVDVMPNVKTDAETVEMLRRRIRRYKKYYKRNKASKKREQLAAKRRAMIQEIGNGTEKLLYHGPEFMYHRILVHAESTVFPLASIEFEGLQVNAPREALLYLNGIYGENIMQFPTIGVEHHGSEQGKLSQWAEKNNIDMQEIRKELDNIYTLVKSETGQ